MLQEITVEHRDPRVIAHALRRVIDFGVTTKGRFICQTPPIVPYDEHPSHTLSMYRAHHGIERHDVGVPLSGFIGVVGTCNCLDTPEPHRRLETPDELEAAVLALLSEADPSGFLAANGTDGPFQGTDATIVVGYRLHYYSWAGYGFWLSFRHIYIGK